MSNLPSKRPLAALMLAALIAPPVTSAIYMAPEALFSEGGPAIVIFIAMLAIPFGFTGALLFLAPALALAASLGGSRELCMGAGVAAGLAHTAVGHLAGLNASSAGVLLGFLLAGMPEAQQDPFPLAIAAALGGLVSGFVYWIVARPRDERS